MGGKAKRGKVAEPARCEYFDLDEQDTSRLHRCKAGKKPGMIFCALHGQDWYQARLIKLVSITPSCLVHDLGLLKHRYGSPGKTQLRRNVDRPGRLPGKPYLHVVEASSADKVDVPPTLPADAATPAAPPPNPWTAAADRLRGYSTAWTHRGRTA